MKGIIKLAYSKRIDSSSASQWERQVFAATHMEFYMQAQQFDQEKKFDTFQEIVSNKPKAHAMHYLVSTAVTTYIRDLNNTFPDVFNTQGKRCVPFTKYQFEVLQSSVSNKSLHSVVIHFYSDPLIWIDTLNENQMVITKRANLDKLQVGNEIETETINLNPLVGIVSFSKL